MDKLTQILAYAQRGWKIFPLYGVNPTTGTCACKKTDCRSPGKHPLLTGGFKVATTDENLIRSWQRLWPDANWGMRTGSADSGGSGVVVVDIDAKNHGFDAWDALMTTAGDVRLDTVTVLTGNLGLHYWFQYPEGVQVGCSAGKLGRGLDLRGDGGYVVVPPSVTSHPYQFTLDLDEFPLAELPNWLLEELENMTSQPAAVKPSADGGLVPQGERHGMVVGVAAALKSQGLPGEQINQVLHSVRDTLFESGDHPVSDEEIKGVVRWIERKHPPHSFTDLGNALRFRDMHQGEAMYCFQREKWITWNGKCWVFGDDANVLRRSQQTVEAIRGEAARAPDKATCARVMKHANRSESASAQRSMLYLATAQLPRGGTKLESHHGLITVRNGILDLATGELRPHDPSYYFTRMLDITYDPKATCPNFMAYLDMISGGNQQLVDFLQMAGGYTLTGFTSEQCLFYIYGDGANGKTTFINTLIDLMGEYAEKVSIQALLENRKTGSNPRPDIVKMEGARLVVASELPFNRRLDEALVKELTGGDAISFRALYQDDKTFYPTQKLWVVSNYMPVITGTDEGIKRRLVIIPFEYTIPLDLLKPMHQVKAMFDAEMPGILTFFVKGAIEYHKIRLPHAKVVSEAIREFRVNQDIVAQFVKECCVEGEGYTVEKSQLYQSWRNWCEANGEFEWLKRSKNWLTRQLVKREYEHCGKGKLRLKGLKLR